VQVVVPAALKPLTVTVAAVASDIVVGLPETVPELHATATGTLSVLWSEKTFDTVKLSELSELTISHVPTDSFAEHVPAGVPSPVYPGGTVSVAVHVVPLALVKPLTVKLAGEPSAIVVGVPLTLPSVHVRLTGTVDSLSSEKSLLTVNDALTGSLSSFVNVQSTLGCALSCLLRSIVAGLLPLTSLSGEQLTLTAQPLGTVSVSV
jgi:hypothetical protein